MKKILSVLISTCLLHVSLLAQTDIESLLPAPFELPGMQRAGEAEIYEGEDLFDLINGGAEVYLEYGFRQVVSQNYTGINAKTNLRVEIYEMTDPSAAFGILSFSSLGLMIIDKISHYLVPGDGFGMMQKGSYFVIASYANIEKSMQRGVLNQIVTSLDNSITKLSRKPPIFQSTQPPCSDYRQSLYFRGKLALQNVTYLDFKIPFDYSEGVYYGCFVYDFLKFNLDDDKSRKEIIEQTISNILNKNPDFYPVKQTFGFSVENDGRVLYEILPDGDWLTLIKYY
jgi:hypothetical protein